MKIAIDKNAKVDLFAIQSAINSINLSCQFGVTRINEEIIIEPSGPCILNDEQESAIKSIVDASLRFPFWNDVRRQRASLLFEADWRINRAMDNGEDVALLIEYRRALRDITKQESPDTVVWPTKPW